MARHANANWNLPNPVENWQQAQVALLMDLRDQLGRLSEQVAAVVKNTKAITRRLDRRTREGRRS